MDELDKLAKLDWWLGAWLAGDNRKAQREIYGSSTANVIVDFIGFN